MLPNRRRAGTVEEAIRHIIMRSITSRTFIVPVAGAAFLLALATSLPVQIVPASAAVPPSVEQTTASTSVAAAGASPDAVERADLQVFIEPQPEQPPADAAPAASGTAPAASAPAASGSSSLAPISGGASVGAIFADLNAQRVAAGLPPFASHGGLSGVAQGWSTSQASSSSMSHNPAFAAQVGAVGCGGATENVASAMGSASPVGPWMASPPHRANILSSATHLGVGAATSTNGLTYYTLNFANC